jgi:phage terminase large subunit
MSAIRIQLPEKLEPLRHPKRYKIIKGGRGSTKSWSVARQLLLDGVSQPLRILCAREIQNSIAESVHKLLDDQIGEMGLREFYTVQQQVIMGANGTEFVFAGIRGLDVAKLKSFEGVDRAWVEEGQTVTKRSWDIFEPTIRKPGSEIWITFNPELETDETFDRFVTNAPVDSIVIDMNWRDNPWFSSEMVVLKDRMKARDPEGYETIWEGKCRPAVEGAIYRKEIEAMTADKRFRPVPYDQMLRVHTVWDLGWNDLTSIIMVQRLGGELRIIDFYEDSHRTLPDYLLDLKARKYNWGTDYLPHDGDTQSLTSSGLSARDILTKLGRNVEIIPRGDVEAGIKAARIVFSRCYFERDKCAPLVGHLKRYRRQINNSTMEPMGPLHDEHSHASDSFRYLAMIADRLSNDDDGWNKKLKYDSRGII